MSLRLAFVLALTGAAVAQAAGGPSLISLPAFRGVFVGATGDDGATWIRGERYKLGLSPDGACFVPLFGPQAPRDYPLQLGLQACASGGIALPLAAGGAWQRDGQRFTRDRGAARECWRVLPGGAEQYFEIDRPSATGSLVLRVGVASDLTMVDDGPGVRFVAARLGHVHYSDAVVIDARGERLDLPVEVGAGQLVITVPAAFTATAVWPLTVDPLLTPLSIDTTVSDVQDAKVACEPTTGNWLVVAEEHLSATDVDIVCKRYDNAATPALLDTTYAALGTDRTHNPDVGFVAQAQRFIVAWHNATLGNFQWLARDATAVSLNAPFNTSAGIGADPGNRPAIGSTLAGDRFLLVLFRKNLSGTDVLGSLLRPTGTNFGTLFVGPVVSPVQGTVVPGDVSVAASLADKWVIVWRECTSTACSSQLVRMQAVISNAGIGPLTAEPAVTLATEPAADSVRIAGHSGNLLAVWRAFDATANANHVHGVPIAIAGGVYTPQGAAQDLSAQEPNCPASREKFHASVSYDGVRFVYGYLEDDGTDILQPHVATVFVAGSTITWHEGHLALSSVAGLTCRAFDLGHGGTGTQLGHHWAVWQQDSAAFTGDVHAALIDARKPGPTSTITQTGCGLPSEPVIALTGTPALGRTFTVSLGNIPVFPVMIVGPENVSALPPCGTCMLGVDLNAMQLYAVSSLAVTVPVDPALLQFRLAFQGLSGLQTGGCPTSFVGFAFALSDTLTIQVL